MKPQGRCPERDNDVALLTPEQRADYEAAMEAMRGLPEHKAIKAWNKLTPGISWTACAKWWMAIAFAERFTPRRSRKMEHVTIEAIKAAMDEVR